MFSKSDIREMVKLVNNYIDNMETSEQIVSEIVDYFHGPIDAIESAKSKLGW